MKGLDTNVLVRYLTEDDPVQSQIATRAIEAALESGDRLLIQPVVLCELVWVLETAYRLAKKEIVRTFAGILDTAQLEIVDKDLVHQALADYRQGRGDFADYLIGRSNARAGADVTLTFDGRLKTHASFELLGRV